MSERWYEGPFKPADLDESKALIYAWDIYDRETGELKDRYVGKAKGGAKRPTTHYRRNINKWLAKENYRPSKPKAFRAVHIALGMAIIAGDRIVLNFVCDIPAGANINQIEREQIVLLAATLNRR